MEEKERFELFGEHCIKDNDPDARHQLLDFYVACVILNEQDKHIKELELLLKADKKIKTNSLNGFEKLRHENQQLKEDCAIYKSSINELYKSQKQLAIEELEKALVLIQNAVNLESPEYDLVGLYDAIVNQIKSLKEKNNAI